MPGIHHPLDQKVSVVHFCAFGTVADATKTTHVEGKLTKIRGGGPQTVTGAEFKVPDATLGGFWIIRFTPARAGIDVNAEYNLEIWDNTMGNPKKLLFERPVRFKPDRVAGFNMSYPPLGGGAICPTFAAYGTTTDNTNQVSASMTNVAGFSSTPTTPSNDNWTLTCSFTRQTALDATLTATQTMNQAQSTPLNHQTCS